MTLQHPAEPQRSGETPPAPDPDDPAGNAPAGDTAADDTPAGGAAADDRPAGGAAADDRPLTIDDIAAKARLAAGEAAAADEAPEAEEAPPSKRRKIGEWLLVLLVAGVLALGARTFVVQAFYIPSESMVATLQVNDRVLVNKLSYRFGEIGRGDIVVFDCPERTGCPVKDFIKRVIALPGETVEFVHGDVLIDGRSLREPYLDGLPTYGSALGVRQEGCEERLVLNRCTVREDWVFVLGDNRPNSRDSRWFGPIPIDTVVGRAFFKVWPFTDLGPL